MLTRTQIQIKGIVQGVGFRPFVFAMAEKSALKGQVLNNHIGVLVDVEGEECRIEQFINALKTNPPPLSLIESVTRQDILETRNFRDFRILASQSNGAKSVPISADIATCADCLREMFDPENRRYRYPFINCTNCGPRFTIIESVPYDRERTTMRRFEMCSACRAEYKDPHNRRFHAEPTCCPNCGPSVVLLSGFLRDATTPSAETAATTPLKGGELYGPIFLAKQYLSNGSLFAIKGLGGYHLACDALNADAVGRLRKRKYREDKPFALMAATLDVVEKYCFISAAEQELLSSPQRPIVLLEKKHNTYIPESVAPRMNTLGFMLPYTPLHYLIFENLDRPLVMTSGNLSDEPIAYQDDDAGARLKNIADYHLLHDRPIHIRTDDSVVRVFNFSPQRRRDAEEVKYNKSKIQNPKSKIVLRRSRGFAPAPVKTSFKFKTQILACGAELKSTFCMTRGEHAYVSHHIGDLENLETLRSFTEGIEHFKGLFDLHPDVIAYDLHPEYLSTKYALRCDAIENKIGIQHHHAHIASCMADNCVEGEVIGVAMDGLGFGTDGKLWGGEFFVADFKHAERIAHLDYIPLPGGSKAIREPWRLAALYLQRTFGDDFLSLKLPFVEGMNLKEWNTLRRMSETQTNSPEISSMGRLFDAVSALLGVRGIVNYEGQAAIELEVIAEKNPSESYRFEFAVGGIIKSEPVVKQLVEDLLNGVSAGEVSARFHLAVANLIANVARTIREERNLNRIALSGGVFQNMFLLRLVCRLLESEGFEVLIHRRVPTNDGGISFGQVAIANAQIV